MKKTLIIIGATLGVLAMLTGSFYTLNSVMNRKVSDKVETYFAEHKAELKGDKGDTGDQGAQGSAGRTGYTGAAGADGETGCTWLGWSDYYPYEDLGFYCGE